MDKHMDIPKKRDAGFRVVPAMEFICPYCRKVAERFFRSDKLSNWIECQHCGEDSEISKEAKKVKASLKARK